MKKIDVGQTVSILANVGVIGGIVLLAYELNQNRSMMRAQTRNELAQSVTELLTIAINDSDFQNVVRRGRAGEQLSEDEQWQWSRYEQAVFRYWENVHYQYRNGLYDEIEFAKQKETWALTLSTNAGFVRHWCETRPGFSPEFVVEIDELLTSYRC